MLTITGIDGLRRQVGAELGVSDWHDVTQAKVDAFAEASEDFEPIHVNPEVAAQTPWGVTIAHGLYTLSLGPKLLHEVLEIAGVRLALNYGFNKVRFTSRVEVGARLRMRVTLTSVEDTKDGVLVTLLQSFEVEGQTKPACVAEAVVFYFE